MVGKNMRKKWIVVLLCLAVLLAGCTGTSDGTTKSAHTDDTTGSIHTARVRYYMAGPEELQFEETDPYGYTGLIMDLCQLSDTNLTSFTKSHDGAVKSCKIIDIDSYIHSEHFIEQTMKVGDVFFDENMNVCICLQEITLKARYIGHINNISESRNPSLFNDEEVRIYFYYSIG